MLLQLSCAHGFAAVVGLPLASRCRRRPIRCNYTCLRDQSANVRPSSCRSPKALSWMPKIFSFLSPVDMLNSVLYQDQQAICGMASRSAMAGCCLLAACCLQSTLLAPPAVCVLDDSLHVACKPLTLASLARHYYCMRLPYLPAHPPPRPFIHPPTRPLAYSPPRTHLAPGCCCCMPAPARRAGRCAGATPPRPSPPAAAR